ncbi:hypothetical protein DPMN_158684 [Dreissena polymorpha]|uniref:Uncharacterized protein n=1 Tax=Dreissena polymorpha TaxID=45954 RepID=A0A9D4INF3_DREPO|nr:hypothetical protein DPMN_158684 [Dreissena polymorpha]
MDETESAPDWTEPAEIALNALIRNNWSLLFEEYKGVGAEKITCIRKKKWEEIADKISM